MLTEEDDEEFELFSFDRPDESVGDDDDGDFALGDSFVLERLPQHVADQLIELDPSCRSVVDTNRDLETAIDSHSEKIREAAAHYDKTVGAFESLASPKMFDEDVQGFNEETAYLTSLQEANKNGISVSAHGLQSDGEVEHTEQCTYDAKALATARQQADEAYDAVTALDDERRALLGRRKALLLSLVAKVIVKQGSQSLVREITSIVGASELSSADDFIPASSHNAGLVSAKPQKSVIYNQLVRELHVHPDKASVQ